MAVNSDVSQILGTIIILRDPSQWTEWIGGIKTHALNHEIWDYVDPNTEAPKTLTEPTEPDDDCTDREYKRFERNYRKWETTKTSLRNFRTLLVRSVDQAQAKDLIAEHVDPKNLLVAIRKRFAPTEKSRKAELKYRYYALQKSPRIRERETWIREWREVVRDLKTAKMALADEAKEDFYRANCEIDRIFAEIKWDRQETETEDFDTFSQHFVDKYREKLMELKLQGAFATSNTLEPTLNGEQADHRQERSHNRSPIERICICGSPHHKPRTCFYIDERKRPEGWTPHNETVRTVNEKIEKGSVRLKQMIERIRKATYNPEGKTPRRDLRKKPPIRRILQYGTARILQPFQAMKINLSRCQQ